MSEELVGFLAFIIVFGITGVILFLVIALLNGSAYRFLINVYKKITNLPLKSELDKANKLHKCSYNQCNRLFRSYQHDMYVVRHDNPRCPHCEKTNYSNKVSTPDKWMDTHPDCPKLTRVGYMGILKTIDMLHKLRKEDEQQQRFEEYNKLKVDFSWVKNLEKEDVK